MHGNLLTASRSARLAPFRRLLAVLFVSLFVISGIAHALHDVDAFAKAATAVEFLAAPDQSDYPAKSAVPEATHCHGCLAVAMPDSPADSAASVISSALQTPLQLSLSATARRTDTPPPKQLA
jgi:hypothetical protein